MTELEKALRIAAANLGRSVVRLNPHAKNENEGKHKNCSYFGIKNTDGIPAPLIDKLRAHPDFLWLTIDRMADIGRSVDTDLVNPLTYRLMTGSTSGGCINILKGINNLCIGTDGGGSVLAPALSTNLFSFMGKGCGLQAAGKGKSTDGLSFFAGIGLISSSFETLRASSGVLCETDWSCGEERVRVTVPEKNSLTLPGGADSNDKLLSVLSALPGRYDVKVHRFSAPYDRSATVEELNALFRDDGTDLILTYEGPVDVFGYDETIPRAFEGPAVRELTGAHSKALVKAANLCGCSALTVPGPELAAGYVITCARGHKRAAMGFALASHIQARARRPEIFKRFYVRKEKYVAECVYR
jgi:hypothetical protein